MTPLERAVEAAWTELERQGETGRPGPYVDRAELSLIDGEVDMPALARAILAAIREPSEAMCRLPNIGRDAEPEEIWQAMIDAALAEGE